MTIRIFDDYESLSRETAKAIADVIRAKPTALICVASGDTPRGTFLEFVKLSKETKLDLSNATFIGLDEWLGISPDNPGSCGRFIRDNLFDQLPLNSNQIYMFDGLTADPEASCREMDDLITTRGGIDCILVGIGLNGHVGLNEPGTSPDVYCHVSELAEETRQVGQKYFQQETMLTKGITVGLKHMLEAKTAILIANGSRKSAIIKRTIEGPITPEVPSTILHKHPNSYIFVDREAADGMDKI